PALAAAPVAGEMSLAEVRRVWPAVLDRLKVIRRFAWMQLSGNAQVKGLADGVLTIGFSNEGAYKSFGSSGNDELLRQALIDEVGVDWRVEPILEGPGTTPAASSVAPPAGTAAVPPGRATSKPAAGVTATQPDSQIPAAEALPEPAGPTALPSTTEASGARPAPSDAVVDDSEPSSELLARELGAQIISDVRHNG
ncbi:MAG: hypothetical protein ACRDQ1_17695, partial [Sciscionella sp.]